MPPISANTRAAIQVFLDKASRDFPIKHAILFGSRARGDHTDQSDADVALIMDGPAFSPFKVKWALADLSFDTLLETGLFVQAMPIHEEDWNQPQRYTNPAFLENVRLEGLPL